MKFNTTIPSKLKPFYEAEISGYREELRLENFTKAWHHLERAYVIGQAFPFEHSYVHWEMLKFGIRIKSWWEVVGQLPRLLIGGVKSFVGKIPVGNTGGANIPPLKSLPIPPDIQDMFKIAGS